MRAAMRDVGLCAALLLLGGCATRGPSGALPPALSDSRAIEAAEQRQSQREQWLRMHPQWSFEGRVAINNAGKGGNGRIEWQQDGTAYVVSLSAPVTRQSWRLTGDAHSGAGTLEGLAGGPRHGEDADALLLQATGWDIPVNALAGWVRGLQAEGVPVEVRSFSTDGRVQTLRQAGWDIDYTQWTAAQDGRPELPSRIEARRDRAVVRLLVDHWDFSPP
ncbi:MAG: lipoprotein insertase outer membrane protein LolB [Pseudoxanthomonas sp.]